MDGWTDGWMDGWLDETMRESNITFAQVRPNRQAVSDHSNEVNGTCGQDETSV